MGYDGIQDAASLTYDREANMTTEREPRGAWDMAVKTYTLPVIQHRITSILRAHENVFAQSMQAQVQFTEWGEQVAHAWQATLITHMVGENVGRVKVAVPRTWWDHFKKDYHVDLSYYARRTLYWWNKVPFHSRWFRVSTFLHNLYTWDSVEKYWDVAHVLPHMNVPPGANYIEVMVAIPAPDQWLSGLDDVVDLTNRTPDETKKV